MAQFYASVTGRGGKERTVQGAKESGMIAHIRGWMVGVQVFLSYNPKNNTDTVEVYRTGGTLGYGRGKRSELICTFTEKSKGITKPKTRKTVERPIRAFSFDEVT